MHSTLSYDGKKIATNLFTQSDFQMTGLKTEVHVYNTSHNFLGYNKRFITDDGLYDTTTAIEVLTKSPLGSRLTADDQRKIIKYCKVEDSHAIYLYGMLVSWYKAKLAHDMGVKPGELIKIKRSGYKDSHGKFQYYGEDDGTYEFELGPPTDGIEDLHIQHRQHGNFWDMPYVLRYNAGTATQVGFYLYHLNGADGLSGLNVDLKLPKFDTGSVLYDQVNAGPKIDPDLESIPWHKPDIIWKWILEYVAENRVEHDFMSAMDVLSGLHAQPMPSYHESHIWQNMTVNVTFSTFKPARGYVPANMEGEPYAIDTTASDFMMQEATHPNFLLTNAALMNYIVWMGLAAVVYNESQNYDVWHHVFSGYSGALHILKDVHARAALASVVFGKECVSYATEAAYISYNLGAMVGKDFVEFSECYDNTQKTLQLTSVPAYVSGSLLIGTVVTDIDLYRHLRNHLHFKLDHRGGMTADDALSAATAYRVFGYDTNFYSPAMNRSIVPFANPRESVVLANSMLDFTRPEHVVTFMTAKPRNGRLDLLPSALVAKQLGEFTLSYTMPVLSCAEWQQKANPLRQTYTTLSRAKAIIYKVQAGVSVRKIVQTVQRAARDVPDFHKAKLEPAPQHPTLGATTTTHDVGLEVGIGLPEREPADAAE